MATNVTSDKKKINVSFIMALIGWGLIYTAVVASVGYLYGNQNQAKVQADTKAAVEKAVRAVSPAPVAAVPKN